MREIALDTETTGISPRDGHRIIEIGALELMHHLPTGRKLHLYINPEREIDDGAVAVHGITSEFLADKPVFADIVDEFLAFVGDDPMVIHNASFDMGFINAELKRLNRPVLPMAQSIDTLMMARKKFPGAQANLDALCRRFEIDNSHRDLHGALVDADLLAAVYIELLGGRQPNLAMDRLLGWLTGLTKSRSDNKRQISILVLIHALEEATEEEMRALNKFALQTEEKINKRGGIGGLNINISLEPAPDLSKKEQIIFFQKPDIIIGAGGRWFDQSPDFMDYFPGLLFGDFDPVIPIRSERVFDLADNLDNRAKLAFFASEFKPESILLCQHAELINNNSKKRYQDALETAQWHGSFEVFALSVDEQNVLAEFKPDLAAEKDYDNSIKIQKIKSRLKTKIGKLPFGSIVVINNPLLNSLISEIYDSSNTSNAQKQLHFQVVDLTDTYVNSAYLIKSNNQDIQMPKLLSQFCAENKFDFNSVGSALRVFYHSLMPVFICKQAADYSRGEYKHPNKAVASLREVINLIDGERNSFLRHGYQYAFKNNRNIAAGSVAAFHHRYVYETNKFEEIYFTNQPSLENKTKKAFYVYVDIKRVETIDIATGTWNVDFELEVNSTLSDPERHIIFPNRSIKEGGLWSVRTVRETFDNDPDDPRYQTKYRIIGTFSFLTDIKQFPFDIQTLHLDISLQKEIENNNVLQPHVMSLIDKEFEVDGWQLISANSGTISEKKH